MPSPSPPLQGSNNVLPKPPNLAPAPLAMPDIPTIETSQNTPLIPQSLDQGGSKRSFRIDAKLFSFSFDGGRSDSYAIHETRRDVKSPIWVGLGVWSGSFLVSPIYETGCLVELYSVRDLEKMGSCFVGDLTKLDFL